MSSTAVHYDFKDGIATIRLDDGKRNALSPPVLSEIYAAFDRAEQDKAIVILTGREEVFSAGFDLKVMKRGGGDALKMLKLGYSLTARVMSYPYPVITAANGHVMAMGVFLMLSTDYTIGTQGDFNITANEVALGLTMPRVAAAMLRHRLKPAAYQRAVVTSEFFPVETAREAGFFDEVVPAEQLMARAVEKAKALAELNMNAHAASKRRIRRSLIRYIRCSVYLDLLDAIMMGIKGAKPKSKVG